MVNYGIVVVVLDGCSIDSLKAAETPYLKKLMRKGVYTLDCKSVFPSVTYTAHASIVTGVYPREHGIVGNTFYDRELGRIVDFDLEDVNRYLQAETLMEKIEGVKACIGEPITKGCNIIISKTEVQSRNLFKQDVYAIDKAIEVVEEHKPTLTMINLPGIDGIGEAYGPKSKQLLSHLTTVDNKISELVETVEKTYQDYLLIILADHGMTTVERNVNLEEILEGIDVKICVSHRAAHIYITGGLREIIEKLETSKVSQLILQKRELKKYKLENPRSGDLVVAAAEDYELGSAKLKGSHGGISPQEYVVPLIVNKPEYADMLRRPDITIVSKIISRYVCEVEAISRVERDLKNADPAHRLDHTLRVLEIATKLALKHGADVEAVRLACIFHDSGRGMKVEGHESRSAMLAERFLREKNRPLELIEKIKTIILKHHGRPEDLKTLEEKILWDADKLDALGIIGIARCLLEEGFKGKTIEDAMNHALRDLEEFKDKMNLPETVRLAKVKEENMRVFKRIFVDEISKYDI